MPDDARNPHHEAFLAADRKHILMITNHGIHQWDVVPGLPDTGGQNVFVNQFTDSLAQEGFKITVVNRGGYRHPLTDEMPRGLSYKDDHRRIRYIEDDVDDFVRKEDMNEHTLRRRRWKKGNSSWWRRGPSSSPPTTAPASRSARV